MKGFVVLVRPRCSFVYMVLFIRRIKRNGATDLTPDAEGNGDAANDDNDVANHFGIAPSVFSRAAWRTFQLATKKGLIPKNEKHWNWLAQVCPRVHLSWFSMETHCQSSPLKAVLEVYEALKYRADEFINMANPLSPWTKVIAEEILPEFFDP